MHYLGISEKFVIGGTTDLQKSRASNIGGNLEMSKFSSITSTQRLSVTPFEHKEGDYES
jgi:hypothetical protein